MSMIARSFDVMREIDDRTLLSRARRGARPTGLIRIATQL